MNLTIDFPATLLGRTKQALVRNRIIAWIAFSITLAAGLICALVWHDPMDFARVGSLGVIVGVVFARWRFLALRKAERKLERALRNPEQWAIELILAGHMPVYPMAKRSNANLQPSYRREFANGFIY
jgi:hypothetical protein